MKPFEIDIELETVTIKLFAKNKTEAKKKALLKLSKINPTKLISKSWPDKKKNIDVNEV